MADDSLDSVIKRSTTVVVFTVLVNSGLATASARYGVPSTALVYICTALTGLAALLMGGLYLISVGASPPPSGDSRSSVSAYFETAFSNGLFIALGLLPMTVAVITGFKKPAFPLLFATIGLLIAWAIAIAKARKV